MQVIEKQHNLTLKALILYKTKREKITEKVKNLQKSLQNKRKWIVYVALIGIASIATVPMCTQILESVLFVFSPLN